MKRTVLNVRISSPPTTHHVYIVKVVRLIVMLFSGSTWQLYLAILLGCPSALIIAGAKSMLSKAIGDDEIGKTFSLLSCGETVANLLGSVTLTTIYGATAADFKGSVIIVDIGINVILILVVFFVSWDLRIVSRYSLLKTVKGFYGSPDDDVVGDGYGTMSSCHSERAVAINYSYRKPLLVPTLQQTTQMRK